MSDTLNRYREAASGLTGTTRKGVEGIVRGLRRSRGAAGDLQHRLLQRSQHNRDAVAAVMRAQTRKLVKRMGLATRADVERLQRLLESLRQRTAGAKEAERETPGPAVEAARKPAGERTADKATAKRTADKATAKRTAEKAPGERTMS